MEFADNVKNDPRCRACFEKNAPIRGGFDEYSFSMTFANSGLARRKR